MYRLAPGKKNMQTRTVNQLTLATGFSVSRGGIRLARVFGQFNGGADRWLQFHTTTLANDGTASAPQAGAAPAIASFLLQASFEFAELFNAAIPLVAGPVYCTVSKAKDTYSAPDAGDTMVCSVEAEGLPTLPSGLTQVQTASGNSLQLFNNAAGPKSMFDLTVTDLGNSGGAQLYLMLFGKDVGDVQAGDKPLEQWTLSAASTPFVMNFNGRKVRQQISNGTNYVGASFLISTTSGTLTLGAANAAILTGRYF